MKLIFTKINFIRLFFLFLLLGITYPTVTKANDYYKIKLNIHVTTSAAMNDTTIDANVDRMNMIFAQCRVRFNVIQTIRGINGDANNITNRGTLRGIMKGLLSVPPFLGSGAGITITGGINNDNNTLGITIEDDPTSVVVVDPSDGETWAHEMSHGMGNRHNGRDTDGDGVDDSFDPDGDGNYDTDADKANLQWPYEDTNTGSALSEVQCDKIRDVAKKIGTGTLNADQSAAAGKTTIDKIFDFFVDTAAESGILDFPDLIFGSVSSIEPFVNTTITWTLDRLFDVGENVDIFFDLALNVDNNESTGISVFNMTGIDKLIEVWLNGADFFSSSVYVSLIDYINFENSGDIPGTVATSIMKEGATSFKNTVPFNATRAYSQVQLEINTSLFGFLSPSIPGVMGVSDFALGADDYVNVTLHSEPVLTPYLAVDTLTPTEGDNVTLSGSFFDPNDEISLFFDDTSLGSVTSDNLGNFSLTLTIPQLGAGTYYLEAIDSSNNLAILVFDITARPITTSTTLSSSTSSPSNTPTTSSATTTSNPTVTSTPASQTTTPATSTSESNQLNLMTPTFIFAVLVVINQIYQRRGRKNNRK